MPFLSPYKLYLYVKQTCTFCISTIKIFQFLNCLNIKSVLKETTYIHSVKNPVLTILSNKDKTKKNYLKLFTIINTNRRVQFYNLECDF